MRVVFLDMDGVIFTHAGEKNFWLALHEAYGTLAEGREATEQLLYTDYDRLVDTVVHKLWKGRSAAPYQQLLKSAAYLPGVREGVRELQRRGFTLAIITSGPHELLERAQRELGITKGVANRLDIAEGVITGLSRDRTGNTLWPVRADNKVPFAEQICADLGEHLSESFMIGDDLNDVPLFKRVGTSIAFNTDRPELIAAATHHVPGNDFRNVLPFIKT